MHRRKGQRDLVPQHPTHSSINSLHEGHRSTVGSIPRLSLPCPYVLCENHGDLHEASISRRVRDRC